MSSTAQRRLAAVAGHVTPTVAPSPALKKILEKNADDIVITCAVRTPLTKARKGALKDTRTDDLLISILTSIRERSGIDPNVVEDVCVGNVLHPSPGAPVRSAVLAAGFPVGTASNVASRFCSSGLLSIQTIASSIAIGAIDVGIAVGAESMSSESETTPLLSDQIMQHPIAKDNVMPMGWTSENVASDFNITREMQDRYATKSHNRAETARNEGWTVDEIAPVATKWKDPETGEIKQVVVAQDGGIRPGTTFEGLSKIRSAFPQWKPSTTTGGNASQNADGAAAVLMMKRSTAEKLGQTIIGKYVKSTVVGLEPRIMGIGPALAIPKILEKTGLTKEDVDLFEINEAFASMGSRPPIFPMSTNSIPYVYCVEKLALDLEKVNVRGGAIAIGHPLGCTGTRQLVTGLSELRRRQRKVLVTSMCVGTGMGMAGVFVSELEAM